MKQQDIDTIAPEVNFLFLSLPRHDGQYTSTSWQIAKAIARDHQVFFVDNPFTFSDLLTCFYNNQIRKRLKAIWRRRSRSIDGVEVIYSPFVFPVNFLPKGKIYNFFSRWNQKLVASCINRVLEEKNIRDLIYVNSFNFYFPDLYKFITGNVRLNIYHCIDPMVKSFTLKHGVYLQNRAAGEADCVISTAPSLQAQFVKKELHKSYLVPNAANFDLFKNANIGEVHSSVSGIGGKVFGYLGNIERRTDFNLLLEVVKLLPDWQLIMAGPVDQKYVPVEFLNHPRIHFTGTVSHEQAPAVVKRFDVAIIPFKCDDASRGIYPLKLFEYLAAGKPVVSTDFNPEVLEPLSHLVHTVKSAREFANSVLFAYTNDSPQKQWQRIQIASENTWEDRARLFKSIISIELKNKYRPSNVTKGEDQEQPKA